MKFETFQVFEWSGSLSSVYKPGHSLDFPTHLERVELVAVSDEKRKAAETTTETAPKHRMVQLMRH